MAENRTRFEKGWRIVAELTDEQIAREREFLEGIPRINIGALLIPPIWGPAHGFWASILFYPVWLFADNIFYAAVTERTPLSIALAVAVLATLVVGSVAFSLIGLKTGNVTIDEPDCTKKTFEGYFDLLSRL